MAVSGNEIASLDFSNLIGGPLNAVVESQAKAAITTANFIKEVAFEPDGSAKTVNFSYQKTNTETGAPETSNLTVPLLTMLPIPYIKVDKATIRFNAKITSTETSQEDTLTQVDASASVKARWFSTVRVKSKTSHQKSTQTTGKEERSFDMFIEVNACNEDMPAGTEKLLDILQAGILETPSGAGSQTPQDINTTVDVLTSQTNFTVNSVDLSAVEADPSLWKLVDANNEEKTISSANNLTKEIVLSSAFTASLTSTDPVTFKHV